MQRSADCDGQAVARGSRYCGVARWDQRPGMVSTQAATCQQLKGRRSTTLQNGRSDLMDFPVFWSLPVEIRKNARRSRRCSSGPRCSGRTDAFGSCGRGKGMFGIRWEKPATF
jgi:hypothetical protein